MEFVRKGDNQGFWMIKSTVQVPNEHDMLKLAEPETVCLAESMQVGLRTLQDAGYTNNDNEGNAKDDDDSKLDIEQQLAPWITTKNFINANANKAMLKLHGEGDPTGRGEAFSFLRTSMKDIFLRSGETMEERLGAFSVSFSHLLIILTSPTAHSRDGRSSQVRSQVQRTRAARHLPRRDRSDLEGSVGLAFEQARTAPLAGRRGPRSRARSRGKEEGRSNLDHGSDAGARGGNSCAREGGIAGQSSGVG